MTEDATLERFDGDAEDPNATLVWAPEARPCDACAARVERRWRAGDRLLCVDCKPWE